MPLRLVEILLPQEAAGDVQELLAGADVLAAWQQPAGERRLLARLLVDAEKTEPVLDRFEQRFGHREGFRAILLPVEATLPRPPPDEPAPEPEPAPGEPASAAPAAPSRVSREELYADLEPGTKVNRVYLATVVISTVVAAVGLMRSNVAIVIGAMVIAPLLAPNMALALGTALGDLDLARRALRSNLAGLATAFLLSLLAGALFRFDPTAGEIAARAAFGYGDVVLALAGGCAGTLAFTSGLSAGLVGVMVAISLLPPLVTAGLLLGAGESAGAGRALVLLAINVICVNLAAVSMFALQGVRPRSWWEADRARRATRIAVGLWTGLLLLLVVLIAFLA